MKSDEAAKILGIPEDASPDQIREVWKKQAKAIAPRKKGESEEALRSANEARDLLLSRFGLAKIEGEAVYPAKAPEMFDHVEDKHHRLPSAKVLSLLQEAAAWGGGGCSLKAESLTIVSIIIALSAADLGPFWAALLILVLLYSVYGVVKTLIPLASPKLGDRLSLKFHRSPEKILKDLEHPRHKL